MRDALLGSNSSFNEKPYLRESHNCYSYLLNLKSREAEELCEKTFKDMNWCKRSQPGYAAGYPVMNKPELTCQEVMKRTLADNPNIKRANFQDTCTTDAYKGALVVAPGTDYHYYRLNDDGYWTHKPGYKPSSQYDASGNMILDPQKANRNYGRLNYKDFCGYFCVPREATKKRMYHDARPVQRAAEYLPTKHPNQSTRKRRKTERPTRKRPIRKRPTRRKRMPRK